MLAKFLNFLETTGISRLFNPLEADAANGAWWQTLIMFAIAAVLVYLAIVRKFEPLLLLPIAIGMLLTNLPGANMFHLNFFIPDNSLVEALEAAFADGMFTDAEIGKLYELGFPIEEMLKQFPLAESDVFMHETLGVTLRPEISAEMYEYLMADLTSVNYGQVLHDGGLLDLLYLGVKLGIYPCLIFMGIGAMTDFSPLISNPKSLLIGAGAQLGVFVAFAGALLSGVFTPEEAAAIGIIGGADGPTAILVTKTLAPALLGAIAIAAYSYMALIPMIQPPFMRMLTTKEERQIKMTALRQVSKTEKILFPIVVTFVVGLIVPDAVPLVGCLMFGNLLNVCGVTERLSKTAQNELMNIVTIFLGITVGATASAANFLSAKTLLIIALGLVAFSISTCGGLITAKIMNWISGGKINPLIGSAGVSAVPMAARVSQKVGQEEDPSNFLLMHAMGPNVAGVIGSAVAAGVFLSWF